MIFQKDIETLPRKEIEAIQLERLKWVVKYCYDNVPLYHQRLTDCGVLDGSKIKQLSDIEYIPFTTKDDFRDNYPFGLMAADMKDIVRIHASSGTTGKPTTGVYTKEDLDIWSDCVARVACAGGVTPDDIIQISFGYGLFTGALGLHYGMEKLGATVIPASSGNTAKQLMMLRDWGVTGMVATPSYALYLSEAMKEEGYPEKVISYTDYVGALMSSVTTIIDVITYVLIAFVAVSLVVSSIMIGIITYISVLERRKEIGILRAMGASRRNVSQVFNAETFIIGLLAGGFGIGLTLLLQIPINHVIRNLTKQEGVRAFLPPGAGGILILLCILLTLTGGFIPARKAARQDPVEALRSE